MKLFTTSSKTTSVNMKNKQRGASTTDVLIAGAVIIAALIFLVSKVPDIRYAQKLSAFQADAATISEAAYKWKKMRPNYSGVNMGVLCSSTRKLLPESICGTSNNGVASNQFGGNWTIVANTNPGLYNITATIPNDADRIDDIADTMAPTTRSRCSQAQGCGTLTVAGTTITMIH